MKSHPKAGQVHLRGKKNRLLSCRCCEVNDYRERERKREDLREIREFDPDGDMRPGAAIALAFALLLSACTSPHAPERDGVWTTVPREQVRCERRADGVVCGSVRKIPAQDMGV